MRITVNFDRDWRFHYGDVTTSVVKSHSNAYYASKTGYQFNPAARDFDDAQWQTVRIPHDYLVSTPHAPENDLSHGFHAQENAWYRKTFLLPKEWEGKQILLSFEGVSINSIIYINGSIMARHNNGYIGTAIDITDRVGFGDRPNTLAVYVDGKSMSGWWYEGAGIYRHVRLLVKDALHIEHDGVYVCPRHTAGDDFMTDVTVSLENISYEARRGKLSVRLFDGDSPVGEATVEASLASNEKREYSFALSTPAVHRWDIDDPHLYRAEIFLVGEDGEPIDNETVSYGYRTVSADSERGVILNGRPVKMKGVCNHQDHAGVGVAVPDAIQDYRVRALKEMGANAYRCAHNPPAPEILDACDRYGLVVMDEHRLFEVSREELSYLEALVRRDRNHPSVIFWSLFNEEPLQNTPEGAAIFRRQRATVERLDNTRLFIGAMNGNADGAGQYMDMIGINYGLPVTDAAREKYPFAAFLGSENCSTLATRGGTVTSPRGKIKNSAYTPGYDDDPQIMSDYDEEFPPWGSTVRECWRFTRERAWHGGMFIWTGFDYRGEPTPFGYPSVSSQFGLMDTCGFPKNAYYYTQACYNEQGAPMLHIAPHWNFAVGDTVRVVTISNCEEVELFLNGKSLGRRKNDVTEQNEWQVDFIPGTLSAIGYRDGKAVVEAAKRTAGDAVAIRLTPDRTMLAGDGQDATTVAVSLVDADGNVLPTATDHVCFSLSAGRILGTGNGNPNSHENDCLPERDLFAGHAAVLIEAPDASAGGEMILRASVAGLPEASITIVVTPATPSVRVPVCTARYLLAFTAAEPTEECPDYTCVISDNDMNSLIPISLGAVGDTFTEGWRYYRARIPAVSTSSGGDVNVVLELVPLAEVFGVAVNGTEVYRAEQVYTKQVVRFAVPQGTALDIRFLVKSWDSKPSGIGKSVRFSVS